MNNSEYCAGTISLSNELYITDPGFAFNNNGIGVWSGSVSNMRPGKYFCTAVICNNMVKEIRIEHDSFRGRKGNKRLPFMIEVNSLQAGMFDKEYFAAASDDDEAFDALSIMADQISTGNPGFGVIDDVGFVSKSGCSNGSYKAYYGTDREGKVVVVRLRFV